jgi:hypothetical protein
MRLCSNTPWVIEEDSGYSALMKPKFTEVSLAHVGIHSTDVVRRVFPIWSLATCSPFTDWGSPGEGQRSGCEQLLSAVCALVLRRIHLSLCPPLFECSEHGLNFPSPLVERHGPHRTDSTSGQNDELFVAAWTSCDMPDDDLRLGLSSVRPEQMVRFTEHFSSTSRKRICIHSGPQTRAL